MALSCQMSVSYYSYTAGQNPPPMANLLVYNPNASPVNITGVDLRIRTHLDTGVNHTSVAPVIVPIGTGQVTLVPALSSITIGPFPIAVGSAANTNPAAMVNSAFSNNPLNPQPSQPTQFTILVGANVYGSDGSNNSAGVAPILVSGTSQPPIAYEGGFLNFSAPNNAVTGVIAGAF